MSSTILSQEFDPHFKLFHELMARKIREILLVSTPYDAWIMEQDCCLSERIINEYRGLNLSHPPRLTWTATAEEALRKLDAKRFDLVVTMPRLADMDAFVLGQKIKQKAPELPVILLSHSSIPARECTVSQTRPPGIDRIFVWSGSTDLLLAVIKSTEDVMNVDADTEHGGIRVILFVEDSPIYLSSLLPIFYKELVSQTQEVMEEGLNEEHRLLTMRARPKILVAENYEEAVSLYRRYEPYILGVISDVRFPKDRKLTDDAGMEFLRQVTSEHFDIPLILGSSEPSNAHKAQEIPADFVDKNSPTLHQDIRVFFQQRLGFGEFIFTMPDGREVGRAANLRELENIFPHIPDESFIHHCNNNDFSRWLFARTEMELAAKVRPLSHDDFEDVSAHRRFLQEAIRSRRRQRQQGVVVDFDPESFDPETDFLRLGKGSLGGKARGLAFLSALLRQNPQVLTPFEGTRIYVPQTLVLTTDIFEQFIEDNGLKGLATADLPDEEIAERFVQSEFPSWAEEHLRAYLSKVTYPLAVRSSSLLEDSQFRAYAGLYSTYMLSNDCPNLDDRVNELLQAVALVYASTYYQAPKSFAQRVGQRTEEEQMAVIIQQMAGKNFNGFFYPAVSGVAQSHNYYPFARMKPEDGIATIAMGLGKMVVEGEQSLRFCPKYPQIQPQRSSVDDILNNAQQDFYCLAMNQGCHVLDVVDSSHLTKRDIMDAANEPPMRHVASTYMPQEHRIRDTLSSKGYPVITFAQILKYDQVPLAGILRAALGLGEKGMGTPVEIEFSVDLPATSREQPEFAFLQVRPMTARAESQQVDITDQDKEKAFCLSARALGNTQRGDMQDIVYVKPRAFDPAKTREIAQEISALNAKLAAGNHRYLLIGPGRWGSADRFLGIPVNWRDIHGVGAIVETDSDKLKAEPSQGSHFFHNITTLGINYLTVTDREHGFLDWAWLQSQEAHQQTEHVAHIRLERPIMLKVDGRTSTGVLFVG
ncbi:PEP/pyruvate-binding domain-containing protein [Desulfovermiculus halophilus]|jgi:CheY-like chemotaxis protein|uniref:PEP/pyruvate-binding domain-containing protein n=1 Tax=Desulfovermiculus halophilus TaxID=339722 RepID=UPI000484F7C5|nr:PEP/pyruvate-binding domain-containing protein [Desulfovermiculus halophilus]